MCRDEVRVRRYSGSKAILETAEKSLALKKKKKKHQHVQKSWFNNMKVEWDILIYLVSLITVSD